jgi:hypothetical protein
MGSGTCLTPFMHAWLHKGATSRDVVCIGGAIRPAAGHPLGSIDGPGPLADTDAGSIVTAAQSGAAWGYRLLLLQACSSPCSTG